MQDVNEQKSGQSEKWSYERISHGRLTRYGLISKGQFRLFL